VVERTDITLFNTVTGRELRRLSHSKGNLITQLAFSPDSRTLAAGSARYWRNGFEGRVSIWELSTGTLRQEFVGHEGSLSALAFAPDGKRLASGASDTTVLLWDLTFSAAGAKAGKLPAKELDGLWSALNSADGRSGYEAMRRLAASPADAAALVAKHITPAKGKVVKKEVIERWLADLEGKRFGQREAAMRELAAAGKDAEAALRKVLRGKPPLELRRRVEQLLLKLEPRAPTPDMVRPLRALELLEKLGTPESRKLLEKLAAGKPTHWLTEEAKASLARLAARDREAER
jgi:hypothetical protein